MKRFFAIMIAAAMLLALAACKGKNDTSPETTSAPETTMAPGVTAEPYVGSHAYDPETDFDQKMGSNGNYST
ncbi:MAG: hypothetical protein J5586_00630, partial [Clostridia bacterium]|nr:hypothetical protein [Clostridia bacterium]